MTAWDPHVYDEWIPFKKTKYPPTPETLETKCGKNVSLRSAIMRMSLINHTKEGSLHTVPNVVKH